MMYMLGDSDPSAAENVILSGNFQKKRKNREFLERKVIGK